MKAKKLLTFAAFAAALAACSKEENLPVVSNEREVYISIGTNHSVDDSQTRTSIEYSDGAAKAATKWQTSDKLLVFGASVKFSLVAGNASANGDFDGSITLGEGEQKHIYALYEGTTSAFSRFSGSDGNVEYAFQHPNNMEQILNTSYVSTSFALGKYAYLYGKSSNKVSAEQTAASVEMKPVTALKQIKIADLPVDQKVLYVDFVSSSPFITQYKLNLDTGVGAASASARNYIRTAIDYPSNETNVRGNMTIFVPLFPQTLQAGTDVAVRITLADGSTYEYSYPTLTSDIVYSAGGIYPTVAALSFNNFKAYTEFASVSEFVSAPESNHWIFNDNSLTAANLANVRAELLSLSSNAERKITISFPNLSSLPANSFSFESADAQTALEQVYAPQLITIGSSGFKYCQGLKKMMSPNVETIGGSSFIGCLALTSINADGIIRFDKVEKVTNSAFRYCSSITDVLMPALNLVYDNAFSSCASLESLNIATTSSSLNLVGEKTFPLRELTTTNLDLVIGNGNSAIVDLENKTLRLKRVNTSGVPLTGFDDYVPTFKTITLIN